ncbi:MAG TPA: hypothetical protein PLQ88_32715, partial [Blastocatellia bacterium]|nr:hypothetical protein [Blastocatellia bacterium]
MTLFHAIPVDRGDETIRAALAATINRARANNLSPENWSLAELHLGEQDLEWLQNWARALDETTAGSWLSPEGAQATLAVRPAAIGVLLLLLTAEQARRSTAGENAWAAACTTCFNEPVRRLLFNRTEPSQLYLGALTQAAQRLHVRLIGDWKTREAERQNIALQIALTEADLPERWPQWLQSDAPPEHIARLLDPVTGSHSFQQLWQTCRDFQRGKIAEAELRAALLNNPWILPRWADSIIAALKPRKQPKVQTAPKPSLPAPLPTEDIFDSLTPYGGVKTIIRAARALLARADRLGLRGS